MLERFDHNNIELIIDTQTGESYASISGYARMVGKHQSTISRRVQAMQGLVLKEAQIQTAGGLQGVALIPEDLICEWMPNDNPELDKRLRKLGVRSFLHKLAGFEISSTAVSTNQKFDNKKLDLILETLIEIKQENLEMKNQIEDMNARLTVTTIEKENLEIKLEEEQTITNVVRQFDLLMHLCADVNNPIYRLKYPKGVTVQKFVDDIIDDEDFKNKFISTIQKRAAASMRSATGIVPIQRTRSAYLYSGKNIAFIMNALRTVGQEYYNEVTENQIVVLN